MDIHQHLLYGLDDGPQTAEASLAMLRQAADNGIGAIIATPHVSPGIREFKMGLFLERLSQVQQLCAQEQLNISIFPGAEVMHTGMEYEYLRDRRVPTLAGTDYALVEFMPDVSYETLEQAVISLLRNGVIPVCAHIERYDCLMRSPQLARKLKESYDVLYQVNCSTVLGRHGLRVNHVIRLLMDEGQVDFVASDAHNVTSRKNLMSSAYAVLEQRYGTQYADFLTCVGGGRFLRS